MPITSDRLQPASTLLLFGATGNVAMRRLLPSLCSLHLDGLLPQDFRVVGAARSRHDDDAFREMVRKAVEEALPSARLNRGNLAGFLLRLSYEHADATIPEDFTALGAKLGGDATAALAVFLSTPPALFGPIVVNLRNAGFDIDRVRIGLEKPLGSDFAASRQIDEAVATVLPEHNIFRIDHYLGKESVQNLFVLRFANLIFAPLWNSFGVDHVQVTISESAGIEGRGSTYDQAGALPDMVENHVLQMLALTAMEPPAEFSASELREEKAKVLSALRPIDSRDMVRGQYARGMVGGTPVAGYVDDLGTPSDTETFVAMKVWIDNLRWRGVPFYLRTGMRLADRRGEIVVQFKGVPHNIFAGRGGRVVANRLVIRLGPEEYVRLFVMTKQPGLDRTGIVLREVPLNLSAGGEATERGRRIDYERLLLELVSGERTLFVRRDEIDAQWRWLAAIRETWANGDVEAKPYAAGSFGPSAAIALIERDGRSWNE